MRNVILCATTVLLVILVAGCGGSISDGNISAWRATAITNALGEAYLSYGIGTEIISVRDGAGNSVLPDMQVLGFSDGGDSLYVVADPQARYHPAITSGKPSGAYDANVYLARADLNMGSNSTSYHDISGSLLYLLATEYGRLSQRTTVGAVRDVLSSLAYGNAAGLVVCLNAPLDPYYVRTRYATEVAQRTNNLSSAFQAIGWQYIYTNYGYSTTQPLKVWVIDPYDLQITGYAGGAGALSDTLIAIVAPTTSSNPDTSGGALRAELTWDEPVDLDLHLVRNGADLYDAYDDCFWKYPRQNWGDEYSTADDPRLLEDADSFGPETIALDVMRPGDQYVVAVDYWGDSYGKPVTMPVTATVRVWTRNNSTPRTFQVTGLLNGEPWNGQYKVVCTIDGNTGNVTINDQYLGRSQTRAVGEAKKR